MAVDNPNVVDGVAIDKDRNALCLLLTDHLAWEGKDALDEYEHLKLLQEKLNAYISFLESGQYKESYPNSDSHRPNISSVISGYKQPSKSAQSIEITGFIEKSKPPEIIFFYTLLPLTA